NPVVLRFRLSDYCFQSPHHPNSTFNSYTLPAMSTMQSFTRALSPIPSIVAQATIGVDVRDDSARTIRHVGLQGSNSVEELIAMIPSDYRDVLRDPLLGIAATVSRLWSAR